LVTEIGAFNAPTGTMTLKEVESAVTTVARAPPKITILFVSVVLKLWPVISTVSPVLACAGAMETIFGRTNTAACALTLLSKRKTNNKELRRKADFLDFL
jgi:hypothetical protein